jgi:hypothetical protein
VDNEAAQDQRFAAMATHHALDGLSDGPGQHRQDPMRSLLNQCRRARDGVDDGPSYMTMPF